MLLTILLLGASACTKKESPSSFTLDETFTLPYQDVAHWKDDSAVKIEFSDVLEDSRCPIDAECVWAGRVTVEVIFTQGDSRQTGKLALGDFTGTGYSNEAAFGNFTVKLLSVKPAPVSYHTIPKGKYALELVIKTKGWRVSG